MVRGRMHLRKGKKEGEREGRGGREEGERETGHVGKERQLF